MPQIDRTGVITFGDASIVVRTEGYPHRTAWADQKAWEGKFKREVFARVVQQLNRMGWKCQLPAFNQREKDQYPSIYEDSRRSERECRRGDLQGNLKMDFGTLKFEMWQDVANVENRNGGRYDFGKEKRMPYMLRLLMEHTRRRLREYLMNVFTGYTFDPGRDLKVGPGRNCVTAMEAVLEDRKHTGHYVKALGRAQYTNDAQQSGDGLVIEDGMRVYALDWHGRVVTGIALYYLGGNWKIVTGKYSTISNVWHNKVFVNNPGDLRRKRNDDKGRRRLEKEMSTAVSAMNFERAARLRDILFPKAEPLFMIWSDKHGGGYFGPNYSGYTNDTAQAGKYTRAELKPYLGDADEKDHLRAVPVRAAA
ncbi:UvrB/UvrC motif-containing protein [Pseudomonas juntendi]|nr:UvrB/UvrC motif-containing protein [Pseudomonas juntendi]